MAGKNQSKRRGSMALSIFLFAVGLCVLLYPTASNYLAGRMHLKQVDSYKQSLHTMPKEQADAEWQRALDYNGSLVGLPVKDPFLPGSGMALPDNYLSVLNVNDTMGIIEIPKINVSLPIYHTTSEAVLEKGVGHIEGMSLPIGGKSTHTVLTGHTGLPTARLFTDLTDLQPGDMFYLKVLNRELAYEVDNIKVIEPEDISSLVIVDGMDYATLITCTPYRVNSHRLLVRGKRVSRYNKMLRMLPENITLYFIIMGCCALALVAWLLARVIKWIRKRKRRREQSADGGAVI